MILLIDSYDSFTNNLVQLCRRITGKDVIVIKNDSLSEDEYDDFFKEYVTRFEFVVIGPGPGNPRNPLDVGCIPRLLKFLRNHSLPQVVPVLGICLGFQSLCLECGSEIKTLEKIVHGQVYDVYPTNSKPSLYSVSDDSVGNKVEVRIPSVRYHSLYVPDLCQEMIPLAYCYELNTAETPTNEHKRIIMAARHCELPFYGVQYHPESSCSSGGEDLIRNFDKIASEHNMTWRADSIETDQKSEAFSCLIKRLKEEHKLNIEPLIEGGLSHHKRRPFVSAKKFKLTDGITPVDLGEYFAKRTEEFPHFYLLNSSSEPREWSIIGLPEPLKSQVFSHSVDNPSMVYIGKHEGKDHISIELEELKTVWNVLGSLMKENYIPREYIESMLPKDFHSRALPFFGGYIGFMSYEEGRHIQTEKLESVCQKDTPDIKLIFIERFILHDHKTNDWFVLLVKQFSEDLKWVHQTYKNIKKVDDEGKLSIDICSIPHSIKDHIKQDADQISFELPDKQMYQEQFSACQRYLHSGDSYELCLTCPVNVSIPSYIDPWEMYKVLTIHRNPAPYSSFMEFDDCIVISSSPERFLCWNDFLNDQLKRMLFRPVKGTVKKGPNVTLEDATRILKTPKEMGENLMIVDLIRHDLHQFLENIEVTHLMSVEEYHTVYQLVSVIEGELSKKDSNFTGIDILNSSLPPGSMTGAPKKRSIHLLQDIESRQKTSIPGGRRGIYSGVSGYWSVTDDSDWSVNIRCMFHYKDDKKNSTESSCWRMGAGGAITCLSQYESEWEEMMTKLSSVLQSFQ